MGRGARLWMLIGATVLAFIAPWAVHADGGTVDVKVAARAEADGTLQITETWEFSAPQGDVTRTLDLRRDRDPSSYYRYRISGVTATVDGRAADLATTTRSTQMEVTVAVGGTGPVTVSYRVTGATRTEQGQDGPLTLLEWPLLQGLGLEVARFDATVAGPAAPQLMDCTAGPRGSVGECAAIGGGTFDQPYPAIQDGPRAPGDELVIRVAYPAAAMAATADVGERWSLDRAFEVSWPTVLTALASALVGAALLHLLHRRAGRDAVSGSVTPVGSFVPVGPGRSVFRVPEEVRPGHVGTVADERVDPIDITATLLDLAVRGHLRITELPRPAHGMLDWSIARVSSDGAMEAFERELLDAVTPDGATTLVSQLPARLAGRIDRIQDALYDDVVARGWFDHRPDSTRSAWRIRGYVALGVAAVAATLLVAFTGFGLTALVLLALGAAVVWVADRMPRRTVEGAALLGGLGALASLLATHPTDEMPPGRELAEISHLLGYAVVLGGKERWLAALVAADADDTAPDPDTLGWYHAPETWHLQDLPASLTQFIHTVQGALYAR